MSVGDATDIVAFHARLFSATENSRLLGALRRLSRLDDPSQLSSQPSSLQAWAVWYDSADEAALAPV